MRKGILFGLLLALAAQLQAQKQTAVLVIGGGTGGTAAAIASARAGAATCLVEEGPWLGGMISAAGVTCTDGNHHLPSGIWNEFRDHLYKVYGGPKAVATGWVSMTQFEPHVSDSIWKKMARAEARLTVIHGWQFVKITKKNNRVTGALFIDRQGKQHAIAAQVTIDATELGDALASAGAAYSLGMEAGSITGEKVGVQESNNIVQDLTWVAILKDYGEKADCTIAKPAGYIPEEFDGSCTNYYKNKNLPKPNVDAKKMLDYGRLPNGKYMINWPGAGNDTYLNVVEMKPSERAAALEKAKQTTLRFVYFIQQELGFKHLGLADDEFPTPDRLALMPYHREGRRVQGLVRMNIRHIAEPFTYGDPLYRTGISVGDYPIDHHHKKNPAAPQHLDFYPVPSYNIPLGALIPKQTGGLIVAEKGISVTNVVNGTTRLQPVVILTGQAAGTLAALSVQQQKSPAQVLVRDVQRQLLQAGAYLMPYYDVKPADPHFQSIQRVGATGLLKGKGIPYQWANQTWFYPDSTVMAAAFLQDLVSFAGLRPEMPAGGILTIAQAIQYCASACQAVKTAPMHMQSGQPGEFLQAVKQAWSTWSLKDFTEQRPITRKELAVLLDKALDPFSARQVDHKGNFIQP